MTQPLVSVVIVNYNRRDDLRGALRSVAAQSYPNREIIVVDNASHDGSVAMLRHEFPQVKVIALAENTGMDGYSIGFARASGEYIFQMDNDSILPDTSVLAEVVRRFEEGSDKQAVVAARVEEVSRDDLIEEVRQRDMRQGPLNTGGFHSGGVGFRRAALREAGGYNRDVFLYGSELFLQMKFLAAGHDLIFYPEILVLHKSSREARSLQAVYYEVRNRYWFMRHYAAAGLRLRYFPAMIVHDMVYGVFKRAPWAVAKAFYHGLVLPLPPSLKSPMRSSAPAFNAKVHDTGKRFSVVMLLRRIIRRARGTNQ